MKNTSSTRFWEIDFLRGIAIILMIAYHFIFDLKYFRLYAADLNSLPYPIFLYPTSTTFLLLVGFSLTLSYSKAQNHLSSQQIHLKFLKRGGSVFALGCIITLVTWVYPHQGFIVFGVLHCIGLSIILGYPLIRYRFLPLLLGILFIMFGLYLRWSHSTVDFPWLVWLGFVPSGFYSLDYFPLLPWFGVVLVGIFLGNSLYQGEKRRFTLRDHSGLLVSKILCFLGRYSLIIYLLHQLIIVGALVLVQLLVNGSRIV